jgi:hypothetical protein
MSFRSNPKFANIGNAAIGPKQVNLLIATGIGANLRGDRLLEFIEFECGINVTKLEEIKERDLGFILKKLRGEG